jgi:hypothetical protein
MTEAKKAPRITAPQFGIGSPTVQKPVKRAATGDSPRTMRLTEA